MLCRNVSAAARNQVGQKIMTSLISRLDKWSKEFDKVRWRDSGAYDLEAVEVADLMKEAAETLRGFYSLVDQRMSVLVQRQ
jgi:hypothetical protein